MNTRRIVARCYAWPILRRTLIVFTIARRPPLWHSFAGQTSSLGPLTRKHAPIYSTSTRIPLELTRLYELVPSRGKATQQVRRSPTNRIKEICREWPGNIDISGNIWEIGDNYHCLFNWVELNILWLRTIRLYTSLSLSLSHNRYLYKFTCTMDFNDKSWCNRSGNLGISSAGSRHFRRCVK